MKRSPHLPAPLPAPLPATLKAALLPNERLSPLHPRAFPLEGWWGPPLNTPTPTRLAYNRCPDGL